MTTYQNDTLPHLNNAHIPVLDLFMPGLNSMFAVLQQLLAGRSNSLTGLLCIIGALTYLVNGASNYLWAIIKDHLGQHAFLNLHGFC